VEPGVGRESAQVWKNLLNLWWKGLVEREKFAERRISDQERASQIEEKTGPSGCMTTVTALQ
jgi:hypothetical protein